MAAAVKDATGAAVQLVQSSGGVFDVEVNGQLIYSKHETGRFPKHSEILTQLQAE